MSNAVDYSRPLVFVEKARFTAACTIAVALFLSVGWTALRPSDPLEATSLLVEGRPWPALIGTIVGLSAVAAAIATIVAGPILVHPGVMATTVGLAVMATRGGTMTTLLMYYGVNAVERKPLALALMLETLLWAAAIAAAWIMEIVVGQWVYGPKPPGDPALRPTRGQRLVAFLASWRDGLLGMLVCAAIAWILISLSIARSPAALVQRGQVYFAVGVAFLIGAMAATQVLSRGSPLWYALAVVLLSLFAYGWGYVHPVATGLGEQYYEQLASTPPNALFRALPIEYLSVGVFGALSGYWFGGRIRHARITQKAAE